MRNVFVVYVFRMNIQYKIKFRMFACVSKHHTCNFNSHMQFRVLLYNPNPIPCVPDRNAIELAKPNGSYYRCDWEFFDFIYWMNCMKLETNSNSWIITFNSMFREFIPENEHINNIIYFYNHYTNIISDLIHVTIYML